MFSILLSSLEFVCPPFQSYEAVHVRALRDLLCDLDL